MVFGLLDVSMTPKTNYSKFGIHQMIPKDARTHPKSLFKKWEIKEYWKSFLDLFGKDVCRKIMKILFIKS